jgi:hypothetical protein
VNLFLIMLRICLGINRVSGRKNLYDFRLIPVKDTLFCLGIGVWTAQSVMGVDRLVRTQRGLYRRLSVQHSILLQAART